MRRDINYKKKTVRSTNTWRLNNTFLSNQQVTEEIRREITKFLETNDNENTTQNLWDAAKAVLRGKFIAIQSYSKKQEKHRIDNLTLHLKLEKEQQTTTTTKKNQISRKKEIIKIQAEINEKEMKETIVKINKTKNPLARFIKKKREKNQINKIRSEKGEVTTDNAEIQRIIKDYKNTYRAKKYITCKKWTNS